MALKQHLLLALESGTVYPVTLIILTWKNLRFTEFSTKIHWNARLAASDIFHMFTQSIKGTIKAPIVHCEIKTKLKTWSEVPCREGREAGAMLVEKQYKHPPQIEWIYIYIYILSQNRPARTVITYRDQYYIRNLKLLTWEKRRHRPRYSIIFDFTNR